MKKIKLLLSLIIPIFVLLIVAGIIIIVVIQIPERIQREHSTEIPLAYQFLTETITFPLSEPYLTREQAEDDLDELEWLFENCYSYLHRKDVDYKAALDAVRISVKDRIKRSQFAWKINKLIALFGDGHSRVRDPDI
ncbi:MAG: hypothetical protein ACYSOP_06235, partial [Planctomycetota bacterium]